MQQLLQYSKVDRNMRYDKLIKQRKVALVLVETQVTLLWVRRRNRRIERGKMMMRKRRKKRLHRL